MLDKKILVVGGYGNVGRIICQTLAEKFPKKAIAAGRNYDRAKSFSSKTQHKVFPRQINLEQIDDRDLENIAVVVMCVDRNNTNLVEKCIAG